MSYTSSLRATRESGLICMPEASGQSPSNSFYVGDWLVEPDALRLVRADEEIKLEPKVMQVLVYLVQHVGQVVSRQQIEDAVWQDMVVGYDSLGSTIIKLRKAFNDDPKNPAVIQTIPKKGYRIIAPISTVPDAEPVIGHQIRNNKLIIATIILALLVIAGWWVIKSAIPDSPEVPMLAVLPFKNMSNDPQQDYFSDGITTDLITDLANIERVAVISRSSVFSYKNIDIDVRQVKKELGVDYIVEGSVRRADDKVRITARLINANNGVNLWADRFDAEYKDIFLVQDRVVDKIISSLKIRISQQEKVILAQTYTNSLEAYDLFLQGWQYFWRYTKQDNEHARELYLKATLQDTGFARAYANLAVTYAFDYMNGWSDHPEKSMQLANLYVNKALELDKESSQVQWAVGIVNTYNRNYKVAIEAAEKSIAQSPNFADAYGLLATVLNYAGRPDEASKAMEKAVKLNPRHPFIYKMIFGQIYFNLREYEIAELYFTKAIERNPTAQEVRLWLAATYAYLNNMDDAGWQLEQIRSTGASLSADYIEQFIPIEDPVLRKHLLDGLIKAGLDFSQPS